jgi:polysaccharide deacetylase 2 family uncharacterized protein YibQ
MNPSGRRILWPVAVPIVVLGAVFAWWVLHPVTRHQRQPVARVVASATPSPAVTGAAALPPGTATPSAAPAASGAELAIVIDDCGQWLQTERAFIALPVPLTLAVLPDVPYTHLIAGEAAAAGKGVMLHLPMETISGLNPGPGKVTTEMSDAQIVAQVGADLADVPLAQGVNNHEGSKATADPRVMRDVAAAMKKHGNLFFVDSLTIGDSVAAARTRDAGIPTATRDVFLDDRADVAYIESQLLSAANIARERGSAIAIGHPRPTTLAAIRALIPRLQAEGIRFVLVRRLVASGSQPTSESSGRR